MLAAPKIISFVFYSFEISPYYFSFASTDFISRSKTDTGFFEG